MFRHRRRILGLALAAGCVAWTTISAGGGGYPSQPVRLVVGTAGGAQDAIARLFAERLSQRLGQPFIVDSRAGAGGAIAADIVARSAPDGNTLLLLGAPNAIRAAARGSTQVPAQEFVAVAGLVRTPELLVARSDAVFGDLAGLIRYAKAHPGEVNYASPGVGTGPHLSGELLKLLAGIDVTHVPYKGGGPAMTDLLGGQVQLLFIAPLVAMPHVKAGKLRILGVTSSARESAWADVPAIAEFLPGYRSGGFFGIGAPPGTPKDIVDVLNREINRALADPAFATRVAEMGATPLPGPPGAFAALLAEETEKWAGLIRFAHISLE